MEIIKTLLELSDGGSLFECDTIKHNDELWLVPEWLESSDDGIKRPARIIALASLQYQEMPSGWTAKFVINEPLPTDVFEGRGLLNKYIVIERPDIKIPSPKGKK